MQEYLTDKLNAAYRGEIPKVVAFSQKVALNYNCLRAIAFELNMGLPFEDAIMDLNIVNVEPEKYDVCLHYSNGLVLMAWNQRMDLFNSERNRGVVFYNSDGYDIVFAEFDPNKIVYDKFRNCSIVQAQDLVLDYHNSEHNPDVDEYKNMRPDYISFSRVRERSLHYLIGEKEKNSSRRYQSRNGELPF